MVNTFLPYPQFTKSAQALDYRRLGKQRVEAWQILQALRGETTGWTNHPATNMWRGHERALCEYGIAICKEWISRGYQDTMLDRFVAVHSFLPDCDMPVWLGDPHFHESHQSNLMRKDPKYYDFHVLNDLPYLWFEGSGYNSDQKLCVTYRTGATKYTQTFVHHKEREPYPEHIAKTIEHWIQEQKAGATN
ncbi:hypothetical protein UFOVP1033_92 [uncultured Caudovirales phage]|uniref:Cytoplasmic protein n=1 Tax=uncultured Caudovirales phage TaxID=2100421 RepID=A0A6J5QA93_9CAUD|nr:hypothetical protein UFOVP1033_92 [uncultured Caudovirales phage]CAB4220874.1 hypothetical protein UFOVP1631_92 [uncultured Caudovirales phage]